ncbi:hypothetical protein FRB95_000818 [Tulasnella sp. JGI-2019a]|nr:hypothetical protein FRB95_000818 [Tulasnella sp. JGI-2019a]
MGIATNPVIQRTFLASWMSLFFPFHPYRHSLATASPLNVRISILPQVLDLLLATTAMSIEPTSPPSIASRSSSTPSSNSAATSVQQSPAPASQPLSTSSSKAVIDQDAKIRNAAAQARHRQKRKAHVAQMEQTLLQLQERLRTTNSDARLRQLQEENDLLHRELKQLRAQWSASSCSDDGYSSSPPTNTPQIGNWLSSQGTPMPANNGHAVSSGPTGHYTSRPGYCPPGSLGVSGSSPNLRYNPMGQRPTPQRVESWNGNGIASDYDLPMPEGFEDLEEEETATFGIMGWNPSLPQ